MHSVVVEEDVLEVVKTGTRLKTIYIGDDKEVYETPEQAFAADQRYNKDKKYHELKKELRYQHLEGYDLYYVEDDQKLKAFIRLHNPSANITIPRIEKPQWVYEEYTDGGDYADSYDYHSFDKLLSDLNKIQKQLDEILNKEV